jgi:hypothetical protein
MSQANYYLGLDLGQPFEDSALAALEQTRRPEVEGSGTLVSHYAVRFLKRWPARTSYQDIVDEVATLVRKPPLDNPNLVIDLTAVGRPVMEIVRRAEMPAWLRPVRIRPSNAERRGLYGRGRRR